MLINFFQLIDLWSSKFLIRGGDLHISPWTGCVPISYKDIGWLGKAFINVRRSGGPDTNNIKSSVIVKILPLINGTGNANSGWLCDQ